MPHLSSGQVEILHNPPLAFGGCDLFERSAHAIPLITPYHGCCSDLASTFIPQVHTHRSSLEIIRRGASGSPDENTSPGRNKKSIAVFIRFAEMTGRRGLAGALKPH